MTAIGFVGNGSDKFTPLGEARVRQGISKWLIEEGATSMVSGHSPVGGVDIWAEEEATKLGIPLDLKIPEIHQWAPTNGYGYKLRNLDIVKDSDILYVILADVYPDDYTGRRFKFCYHCMSDDHVKSGGCWTGKQALQRGKKVEWWVVSNY